MRTSFYSMNEPSFYYPSYLPSNYVCKPFLFLKSACQDIGFEERQKKKINHFYKKRWCFCCSAFEIVKNQRNFADEGGGDDVWT